MALTSLTQIEARYIYTQLSNNSTSKYVENLLTLQCKPTTGNIEAFLGDSLEVPWWRFDTAAYNALYDTHFIFYFAPVEVVEGSLMIKNLETMLAGVRMLNTNKFFGYTEEHLEQLRAKKYRRVSKYAEDSNKLHSAPSLVFVLEHESGSLNEDGHYRFVGVFNAQPAWICRTY